MTNRRIARTARRVFQLCLVDGRLDDARIRQAVGHIAASGRRNGVSLLTAVERLVRLHLDRHTAVVESAVPLSAAVRDGVRATLTRLYGPSLEARFTDNPALIGGMRITVGSDVYDGSVRTRLAALEARL